MHNEAYASSFDKGNLPLPPAKKVALVACMDARLNVYGALGLTEGDAYVIRNAGGIVTDDGLKIGDAAPDSTPPATPRATQAREPSRQPDSSQRVRDWPPYIRIVPQQQ